MEIPQTTPPEAFDVLRQHLDAVYLDVRTAPEFEAGHPAGARHVPVLFYGAGGQPRPNPDFVGSPLRNFLRLSPLRTTPDEPDLALTFEAHKPCKLVEGVESVFMNATDYSRATRRAA